MTFLESELAIMVHWIHERERVRQAKAAGRPKPWTEDPLLRDFRWCNVRRMDDRVSQELFQRWYRKRGRPAEDLHEAMLARLVNWPESLDAVRADRYAMANASLILRSRANTGAKVFTGAYVVPGVPGKTKVDSVCELVDRVTEKAADVLGGSMYATWSNLTLFDGMGSFLAGQVVADLVHLSPGREWTDPPTWAPLGPGSARGINRLLGRPKGKAVSQFQFEQELPALIEVLRPRIATIWDDRGLQAMDVQNCLCEFDKYRRLTLGEGQVRARYDGKAPTPAPRGLF